MNHDEAHEKRVQRKINKRVMTLLGKLQQLEDMALDCAEVPSGTQNYLQECMNFISEQEAKGEPNA